MDMMNQHADDIEIIGASENNLKHIDVTIPKGKLVAFTGVSGSGKSSLAFDTIAVEARRQWQQSYRRHDRAPAGADRTGGLDYRYGPGGRQPGGRSDL